MNVVLLLLLIVLLSLIVESVFLRRYRARIPIRIHVNGTRGKSSVTEYIAVGLRASDRRVFAKITGILPTIFLPDGSLQLLRRRGPARVQEQMTMIRKATHHKADALVLECMSISPEFQRVESRAVRPTIYVITNIRDDHKEEMGTTIEEQVEAMCSAIPMKADVVTAETTHIETIKKHVERRCSRVHLVTPEDIDAGEVVGRNIHPINVALAARVCELAGAPRATTMAAIRAWTDSKLDDSVELMVNKRSVRFINGFAVNDTQSASVFLDHWENQRGRPDLFVVLLNTRSDRPKRSEDFAGWLADRTDWSSVILTGTHVPFTYRALRKKGINEHRLIRWTEREVRDPLRSFANVLGNESAIVGFGNIAGDGFTILDALHGVTSGGR